MAEVIADDECSRCEEPIPEGAAVIFIGLLPFCVHCAEDMAAHQDGLQKTD